MKEQLTYDVQTFLNLRGIDLDGAELVDHLVDDLVWQLSKGTERAVPRMPLTAPKRLALEITIILAQMNAEFTVAGVDHLAEQLIEKGWVHRTNAPLSEADRALISVAEYVAALPVPEGNVGEIEVDRG